MYELLGGAWLAFIAVAILIAILWILLPFAVFGIKPLLKDLAEAGRRRDEEMIAELRAIRKTVGRQEMEVKASPRDVSKDPSGDFVKRGKRS